MPEYMLLIYTAAEGLSPEEAQAEHPRWMEYTQAMIDAGVMRAGNALQGVDTATSVRVRDGETLVTDGPFAETKEILGGYYVIEARDLDEALGWAAKAPNAARGTLEVRPVMVIEDAPQPSSVGQASA